MVMVFADKGAELSRHTIHVLMHEETLGLYIASSNCKVYVKLQRSSAFHSV